MAEQIAEAARTALLHLPGKGEVTLLVFARPGDAAWPGEAAAAALGLETFILLPREAHDFPPEEVTPLLAEVAARRAAKRPLVALGSGGALRHAGTSGAKLVLTFAPRITTAPLPPKGCDVFIFADPTAPPPPWPGASVVRVPGLAAEPDLLVESEARLRQLLEHARATGKPAARAAALQRWARAERHSSPRAFAHLLARLARHGHARWRASLLPRLERFPTLDTASLLDRAAWRRDTGNRPGAIADLNAALAQGAGAAASIALAELLLAEGQAREARIVLGDAGPGLAIPAPLATALRSRAAPLATPSGLDPIRLARRAARQHPNAANLLALGRLLRAEGNTPAATAALRAAALLDDPAGLLDLALGPRPAAPIGMAETQAPAPEPPPAPKRRRAK